MNITEKVKSLDTKTIHLLFHARSSVGIRKDIRARAAIENQAVSGQILHWTLVEDDLPENGNEVLACVNMRTEDGLQMGAIEKASFVREVGWILHGDLNAEFAVVKWSPLPR